MSRSKLLDGPIAIRTSQRSDARVKAAVSGAIVKRTNGAKLIEEPALRPSLDEISVGIEHLLPPMDD